MSFRHPPLRRVFDVCPRRPGRAGTRVTRVANTLLRRGVTAAAAVPLLSGCFSYIPAELGTVPPGGEVRVYLTRVAMAQLPEEIPSGRPYLAGSLVSHERDSLMVRVPVASRQDGVHSVAIRQDVRVPTREILDFQRREFSPARTGLLVAGTVGLATAIILTIIEASGSERGPGELPELSRVPLFSFPLH